ncbi:ribosomal-protein-alanine N-acetyltransferase [Solihabitans fulvus]|uniref:Ribosomal-protein-alanine N-acetyltransferase n=1 Tax=Solihabitans fulvus TaxID=1892852 RepID=A0A5B2XM38_9PSEU|nr:ribosomal protein S18-alanine N-acetyltransferase [Solihabitans fulvus]KAA2264938.1 ribosomal-protein-alanine N-acetyltransferase [Solihabitans fulvus]
MTIGPLRHEDVRRCAELERELFPGDDPWSENAFHAELDHGNYYVAASLPDGQLIGYAGLAVAGREPFLEASVHTIAVAPAFQGSGIGTTLLRTLLIRADEVHAPVFLEVRTDNVRAIALYLAHGFEKLGLRRRYYQPSGADAYTMGRPAQNLTEDDSA